MILYSYCITHDNGAAPNPFWGTCTLAICKPVIRRNAEKGDWIVATGSIPTKFDNKLIYAMEVTEVMPLDQYDGYCNEFLPYKIPDIKNEDPRRWVGDCIYDYSKGSPLKPRSSVHSKENMKRDLGGINVLLSRNFYYLGSIAPDLPKELLPIIKQGQGHKSISNEPYKKEFIEWITSSEFESNKNNKSPLPLGFQAKLKLVDMLQCNTQDKIDDDKDEESGNSNC